MLTNWIILLCFIAGAGAGNVDAAGSVSDTFRIQLISQLREARASKLTLSPSDIRTLERRYRGGMLNYVRILTTRFAICCSRCGRRWALRPLSRRSSRGTLQRRAHNPAASFYGACACQPT